MLPDLGSGSCRRFRHRPETSRCARQSMKSILIADDDPIFRETLAKRCGKLGPRIRTAADGAQAMQSLTQSRPSLMIIDVNMPSGNGLEVVERLVQDPTIPAVPVIFCTGRSDQETV